MVTGRSESHEPELSTPLPLAAAVESRPTPDPVDERRAGARRAKRRRLAGPILPDGPVAEPFLVPVEWRIMPLVLASALVLFGLATGSLPGTLPLGLSGAAIALCAASPLFVRFERQIADGMLQRVASMLFAILLPMVLFGTALAAWIGEAGPDAAESVIAIRAAVFVFAAILLTGRMASTATAALGLWLPVIAASHGITNWLVMAAGVVMVCCGVVRQYRLDNAAQERLAEVLRRQARAEEILTDYEQTGQGWFWETDRRGLITYVSETIEQVLGRPADGFIGRPFTDLFSLDGDDLEGERTLNFHLTARSSFTDLAVRAANEREERWWAISGRPVHDGFRNFLGFRGSGSDLTEMRRSQQNETRLAHYDSLTGLANRFQMSQLLEKILGALNREHRACAVFLLDLDRFKQVNDTLGHPAGDALLKQVAQRLEWTVGDSGRVGRLGGDEFKVILPGRSKSEELARLAGRIIENLSQPYVIDGHRVLIGASVGIARCPQDGSTSEELIRNADLALYAAKDGGRGRHHFYAADLHSDAEERRQMEADLREAIANGSLELHYQPVVETTTERITGFEALVRWTHPRLGALSPAKFVPIAEEAGLISQIGEWALRTACHDLASWPAGVRVAVNVSPLQFANPALPSVVVQAIAQARVDASRLELEITESVFLNDDDQNEGMFAALKRIGVRLALDDFGTGYSSLGYLKKAPFDKIKIDQSFVRGATEKGSRNGAIISSIVNLAEALGMETTAEGVETHDELDLMRALGCSHIQGYIYEKALTATQVTQRLAEGAVAIARGPRSARPARQTTLRRVTLEHGEQAYNATIRNISQTGALVEGLWNVPPGTSFTLNMGDGQAVGAIARWCKDDRMGLEFDRPLPADARTRREPIARNAQSDVVAQRISR